MNSIALSFGNRIRSLRQSRHISQEKLAELSGLHTVYIGQIERGEKSPTLDSIYKIANGLKITLYDLFAHIDCEDIHGNQDYAKQIYNEVIGFSDKQKQTIYKIIREIKEFK